MFNEVCLVIIIIIIYDCLLYSYVCDEIYKKMMQVCDFARITTEKYNVLLGVFFPHRVQLLPMLPKWHGSLCGSFKSLRDLWESDSQARFPTRTIFVPSLEKNYFIKELKFSFWLKCVCT